MRGKGRPKGALRLSNPRAKGQGITSTKRLPSAFEITQAEERRDALPPSSAPPILQPHHDTYEPGTAHPRGAQRYYESLADKPDDVVKVGELDAKFEGAHDKALSQLAQRALELSELERERQ